MKLINHIAGGSLRGGVALLLAIFAAGCISKPGSTPSPRKGGGGGIFGKKKAEAEFFGGADPNAAAEKKESSNLPKVPSEFPIGFIHMVPNGESFVLIRSSRALSLKEGTKLMTYDSTGKPTSKLSLSPERQGEYFIADLQQGIPNKGDRVIAMGVIDPNSRTTSGLVPGAGFNQNSSDVQVLE